MGTIFQLRNVLLVMAHYAFLNIVACWKWGLFLITLIATIVTWIHSELFSLSSSYFEQQVHQFEHLVPPWFGLWWFFPLGWSNSWKERNLFKRIQNSDAHHEGLSFEILLWCSQQFKLVGFDWFELVSSWTRKFPPIIQAWYSCYKRSSWPSSWCWYWMKSKIFSLLCYFFQNTLLS